MLAKNSLIFPAWKPGQAHPDWFAFISGSVKPDCSLQGLSLARVPQES